MPEVAMEATGFATKAGRSRRFGPNPRPDFSGDFHPASREINRNVGQPDHILANPIISHKAERRPGSGERRGRLISR